MNRSSAAAGWGVLTRVPGGSPTAWRRISLPLVFIGESLEAWTNQNAPRVSCPPPSCRSRKLGAGPLYSDPMVGQVESSAGPQLAATAGWVRAGLAGGGDGSGPRARAG